MSKNTVWVVVGTLFAVLIVGIYLSLSSPGKTSKPQDNQETENVDLPEEEGGETEDGASIVVKGSEYVFFPTNFSVEKDEKVTLTLKNVGFIRHDFVIDELEVATDKIESGEETTIEFTPSEVGEYKYYCSIGNHRSLGMEGTLYVK